MIRARLGATPSLLILTLAIVVPAVLKKAGAE
jgi:hypothetical protein